MAATCCAGTNDYCEEGFECCIDQQQDLFCAESPCPETFILDRTNYAISNADFDEVWATFINICGKLTIL